MIVSATMVAGAWIGERFGHSWRLRRFRRALRRYHRALRAVYSQVGTVRSHTVVLVIDGDGEIVRYIFDGYAFCPEDMGFLRELAQVRRDLEARR